MNGKLFTLSRALQKDCISPSCYHGFLSIATPCEKGGERKEGGES